MNKPVSLEDYLKDQLKDPEFRKEHDALEEEFDSEWVRIEKQLQSAESEEKSDES